MRASRAKSRLYACLLIAFATLRVVTSARAQDGADAQQSALARALFDEGVALGDAGEWVGASDRFGRAYALRPTPNVAYNWASALIETHALVQAQELLLSVQRDETASPELKRACSEQSAALAQRIPHVRFEVQTDRDLALDVDGRSWPRAAWNVTSPLDPGPHVARLHDGGRELAREEFSLREGEASTVSLDALPGEASGAGRRWWRGWPFWTAVGVVAVGGVVAGVVLAARKDSGEQAPLMGNAAPGVLRW
ncbi:MAG TPA: hypothetical protein VFX59_19290 [Polyangiales bacterium]|nr:hypothetical protein [Polyangiales bacterium]